MSTPVPEVSFPASQHSAEIEAIVLDLWRSGAHQLDHGGELTGRPGTQVFRDEHHLLKVRREYSFSRYDAERWVLRRIEEEHALGVYHPAKVWMLLSPVGEERPLIANLVPLLSPLHTVIETKPVKQAVRRLGEVVDMILAVGAQHQRLLDGGLSNFGLDDHGRLYYLDDDTYPWDRFLGLTHNLAHWIRAYPWISGEAAARFGVLVRASLGRWFPQPITPVMFSNHLRDLPMPAPAQREATQAFLEEINRVRPKASTPAGSVATRPARMAEQPKSPATTEQAKPVGPAEQPRLYDVVPGTSQPFAVLADIHGNAAALEAVLAELDREGIGAGLVLGDLVGYGPEPGECIRLVRERGYQVLMGNHDYGVAHGEFQKGFSSQGRQVAEWTAKHLPADDIEWLAGLPMTITGDGWMAVHGAPSDKARMLAYVYRMTYERNLDYLAEHQVPICFHGHTHIEGVYYRRADGDGFCADPEQTLTDYRHCLVCPGSIGQPRGGNGPDARYAIVDPVSWSLRILTVPYDLERTVEAMRKNSLPEPLTQRLLDGL